jgi:hypothetical protein
MKSARVAALLLLAPSLLVAQPAAGPAGQAPAGGAPRFVAGLAPYERPAGAPAITEFSPSADWRKRALAGVSEPIPKSLGFLDNQGAWYTPFTQPGMPSYYDLRQMHGAPASGSPTSKK